MDTLRLPLSFVSGAAVVNIDASKEFYEQILSIVIQTEPGELAITKSFGIPDPSFSNLARINPFEGIQQFIPEIEIKDVSFEIGPDQQTSAILTYTS